MSDAGMVDVVMKRVETNDRSEITATQTDSFIEWEPLDSMGFFDRSCYDRVKTPAGWCLGSRLPLHRARQ